MFPYVVLMIEPRVEPPILDYVSMGCHEFVKVGIDFIIKYSWVVKTRFHGSRFARISFHVGHFAHPILVEM